jgi:hypothetical protein
VTDNHAPTGRILVATESFSARFEGSDHGFTDGRTTVREGHPILKGIEHLFRPITPNYEWQRNGVEQATAAPGEHRVKV